MSNQKMFDPSDPATAQVIATADRTRETAGSPRETPGASYADELAALVAKYSTAETCTCGASWGALRAARVASRALSRAAAQAAQEQERTSP
jgi:hypothetical protein